MCSAIAGSMSESRSSLEKFFQVLLSNPVGFPDLYFYWSMTCCFNWWNLGGLIVLYLILFRCSITDRIWKKVQGLWDDFNRIIVAQFKFTISRFHRINYTRLLRVCAILLFRSSGLTATTICAQKKLALRCESRGAQVH